MEGCVSSVATHGTRGACILYTNATSADDDAANARKYATKATDATGANDAAAEAQG